VEGATDCKTSDGDEHNTIGSDELMHTERVVALRSSVKSACVSQTPDFLKTNDQLKKGMAV
jgi:hypothetical protein